MAQKSKSWVHELFWPKHPDTGHYRFCKICNEECPDPRQVAELQKKGTPLSSIYMGVVQNDCSPSSMINHVRAKHEDQLPEHTPVKRKRSDLEEEEMPCKDHRLLRDWATNMCLGSMCPVKMVRDPNVRKTLHKRLGGLPTDTQIRSELQDVISDIRASPRTGREHWVGKWCGFLVPDYIEIIFEHCSVDIPLDTFVHNLVNTGLLCFQCLRSTPDVNIHLINVRI